ADAAAEVERLDHVIGEHDVEQHRDVPPEAVAVLQDQREAPLTAVLAVRLTDGAGRRREPERPVIELAVVVASRPETERAEQDNEPAEEEEVTEGPAEGRCGGVFAAVGHAR